MINVLFICLGNICRSPMAEAVFRHIVQEKGLQRQFHIDSAGMGSWHIGNPPHKGTRKKLESLNISYEGQKARRIDPKDLDKFDYIIAMDQQNMDDLYALSTVTHGAEIRKLMDFVEDAKEKNVPDPYFTKNFDYTYELVQKGCEKLYDYLVSKHFKEKK
ncbi:low molecular weight protein-tyrosine-phosphatase [Gracilibacillus sp. YIM 98692]|uniref:low molecular weight protein-tyrosine-phosphatase n=1 Tax=Gracilibacillus sp. YIM 98692 TaxID=2663532 RepID=UPI0013D3A92A|nr:low molecular weight protein-tyrosine-phosphatase [Gracilibacillus sp. YIM 98692]